MFVRQISILAGSKHNFLVGKIGIVQGQITVSKGKISIFLSSISLFACQTHPVDT